MTINGICLKCGNERKIFYAGMCQKCYKQNNAKKLAEIENRDKEIYSIYTGWNERVKKVIELRITNKYTAKEIATMLNCRVSNVRRICKQYIRWR